MRFAIACALTVWTSIVLPFGIEYPSSDRCLPTKVRSTRSKDMMELAISLIKSWNKYRAPCYKTMHRRRKNTFDLLRSVHHKSNKWARQSAMAVTCVNAAIALACSASQPATQHHVTFDTDSYPIKVDNCATASITWNPKDFISPLIDTNIVVGGLTGSKTHRVKKGTVLWPIEDDEGKVHQISIPNTFLVVEATTRLLSPQHWAVEAKDNYPSKDGTWCGTYHDRIILQWGQRQFTRTIPLDRKGTFTGTIQSAPGFDRYDNFCSDAEYLDIPVDCFDAHQVSDDEDDDEESVGSFEQQDDSDDMPELRAKPYDVDFLFKTEYSDQDVPVIIDEEDSMPQDASADFLRWHHRLGHPSARKIKQLARQGILPKQLVDCRVPKCTACLFGKATRRPWRTRAPKNKAASPSVTAAGQCVSVDQMVSKTPGLVGQLRGTPTRSRYEATTVFVDQFSGLSYVHVQKTTSAADTIEAKDAFERFAASHGVRVLHYHADNGIFADNKWRKAIQEKRQTLSFCGVNAHWQNGMAERRIRELRDHARTMLIQAHRRWPEAITTALWPYAIRMANDLHNNLPGVSAQPSPMEQFSGAPPTFVPKNWFHFGAPVYVLANRLQAQQAHPKWKERSRIGIYLGQSPQHARNVALVLSLTTGLVSPQYHVTVDSNFETMRRELGGQSPPSHWQARCHFREATSSTTPAQGNATQHPEQTTSVPEGAANLHRNIPTAPVAIAPAAELQRDQASDANLRRSSRSSVPPQRLIEVLTTELEAHNSEALSDIASDSSYDSDLEVIAFLTGKKRSDPDTLYLHEALRQPDRKQFIKAMQKEVQDMKDSGHWHVVQASTVPEGATILPGVWALRRKRRIATQEIYKWKARLNLDGSKQTYGKDYWETYAPVAAWPIIRWILTLTIINGWKSKQLDYVMAYPQADIETDHTYMKIPRGFEIEGSESGECLLKVTKNVYGGRNSGRTWYLHLLERLTAAGFVKSAYDDCLFYRGQCMYVLYTDDSIIVGPTMEEIDDCIQAIKAQRLNITVEGDLADFLGVEIKRHSDGTIHLTQPHIISQILKDVHLDKDNVLTKMTPAASSKILGKHRDSSDFDGHFDYRSVIGKLNFLERSSRPDISYAVHQCARHSANPKKEHGQAVIWLCRYLAATRDKGIILRPDASKSLECYVDADFAGNWLKEESQYTDTARSRSGFVITYAGCPICWGSKLQTLVALSTTEAEYISASNALREVIPLMHITREARDLNIKLPDSPALVFCRLFEDNEGALAMLRTHKVRPRTKHLSTRVHHFVQHVEKGDIICHGIDTKDQPADILTKPVDATTLRKHRFTIMGWH